MRNPRTGTVITIIGSLFLGGCVTGSGDKVVVADRQNMDAVQTEVHEEYYPDGGLKIRVEGFLNGDGELVPHGARTLYWENGQKKYEEHYVQGMRHGTRSAWYESGQLRSEGRYVNGGEDGTWTEWYPDGRKMREIGFDNGAFHGTHTQWHPNGQKKLQFDWVKGKRQGTMTLWDEDGNVASQVEYVDDVVQP